MARATVKSDGKQLKERRFISLRWIASVAAAALVAFTVLVSVGVSEQNMRTALIEGAETQLVLEARNLAITSAEVLLDDFPELMLVPLIKDMRDGRPELLDVAITDHVGKIQGSRESRDIGTDWQKPAGLIPTEATIHLVDGERLSESADRILVECPIRYGNESDLGWVTIILDKGHLEAKVGQTRLKMMTIALVLLVVAVLVTALVMSNLFRPISVLKEGLERIGQGELDSPMEVRDRTELGMLADSVNIMAGELKTSQSLAQAREVEVIETQKEIIVTLGQVVESRSSETANHTVRVGDMSYELARLAGLSKQEAELIRIASPMHDVGKIGISDDILNKPGKLTDAEYTRMKDHAEIGFSILNKSHRSVFKASAIIAHEHHERWDGKGYPRGLKGEEIHIYGRIVGLVDVFDAIFSNRIYRPAMPLEKALGIIREESGHHFDPRLAGLFLENLPRFLAITERYEDWPIEEPIPASEMKANPAPETVNV